MEGYAILMLLGAASGQASLWEPASAMDYRLVGQVQANGKAAGMGILRERFVISTAEKLDHDTKDLEILGLDSKNDKLTTVRMKVAAIQWHQDWNSTRSYQSNFGFAVLATPHEKATPVGILAEEARKSSPKFYAYRFNNKLALAKREFQEVPLEQCLPDKGSRPKKGQPKPTCAKPKKKQKPGSLRPQEMGTPLVAVVGKGETPSYHIAGILTAISDHGDDQVYLFSNVDPLVQYKPSSKDASDEKSPEEPSKESPEAAPEGSAKESSKESPKASSKGSPKEKN